MTGIIFSIVAGMAMSIQGVMNTRLAEQIGLMESNAFAQCTAALLSLAAVAVYRTGSFAQLGGVNRLYLLGGALGLVISLTVMLGMKALGPTVAVSLILVSQLSVAALIEAFGLMGSEKLAFGWSKFLGMGLMIGGILLFKLKN